MLSWKTQATCAGRQECPGRLGCRGTVRTRPKSSLPAVPPSHTGQLSLNPGSSSSNLGLDVTSSSSSGTQRACDRAGTGIPGGTGDAAKWLLDPCPLLGCGVGALNKQHLGNDCRRGSGQPGVGICRGPGKPQTTLRCLPGHTAAMRFPPRSARRRQCSLFLQ